jgi:hypothetical protein
VKYTEPHTTSALGAARIQQALLLPKPVLGHCQAKVSPIHGRKAGIQDILSLLLLK